MKQIRPKYTIVLVDSDLGTILKLIRNEARALGYQEYQHEDDFPPRLKALNRIAGILIRAREGQIMKTHILKPEENSSGITVLCDEADIGDRAITLEAALDPDSDMIFDCTACHKVLTDNKKHSQPE